MNRLLIHVEGQTEEDFVNQVLGPHLFQIGMLVSARLLGNAGPRGKNGGITAWPAARKDILSHLKGDTSCVVTTMVDYYGLPQSWPGREEANSVLFPQKANLVETGLLSDICTELGDSFEPTRFIPYVMMHEYEGMLFSDCTKLVDAFGCPDLIESFQAIRNGFESPEQINDSYITAPSKRIATLVPGYQKPLYGVIGALGIGLETIRKECPHFRSWLERLEAIPQATRRSRT